MFKKILCLLLALVLALGAVGVAWATAAQPEQPGEEEPGPEEPAPEEPDPEETYTVTFASNGGSAVAAQSVAEGETAARPADPDREGYVFDGWFADEGLTEPFDFATPVYTDMTLYAAWTEDAPPMPVAEFTVTFDSAGGSQVPAQTVVGGDTATRPADPTREGYTFLGWEKDGVGYDFDTPVDEDITLVAAWAEEIVEHTVTFQTNGGSAVAQQTVAEGGTVTRPADPSRSGYTFDGWFTDTGLAIPFDFSAPVTGSTTVYARWKAIVVQPAVTPASVDIRLSYLTIECGELHPAFSPDIYSYTVYVEPSQEERSCRVLCDTMSHEARVEAEGPHTVSDTDVVRKIRCAAGGRYSEYTVLVHVLTFRERIWDGQLYSITDRPNTSVLPGTFTVGQITINGEKIAAAQSTDGQMLLVQFTSQPDGSSSRWFRYERSSQALYPVSIVEVDLDHYIRMDEGDWLLYGSEAGVGTFYVYNPDTGEITYQSKDYDELSVTLLPPVVQENAAPNWPVIIALGAWGAIATAAVCYLLGRSRKEKRKSIYFRPVFSAEESGEAAGEETP